MAEGRKRVAAAAIATLMLSAAGVAVWAGRQQLQSSGSGAALVQSPAPSASGESGGSLEELVLTDAVLDVTLLRSATGVPVQVAELEEPMTYDSVTVRVETVVWTLDDADLEPQRSATIDYPSTGTTLTLRTADGLIWRRGETYRLFVDYDPDFSVPWRAGFALGGDARPVLGLDGPGTTRAIERVTSSGMDTLTAVTQLAVEMAALRQASDREAAAGPMVRLLYQFEPPRDALRDWLAIDPLHREIGELEEDIPQGAEQALSVQFVLMEALVLYDETRRSQLDEVALLFDGVGYIGWSGLNSSDTEPIAVIGHGPRDVPFTLLASPPGPGGTPFPVPLRIAGDDEPRAVTDDPEILQVLANGGGLVIDLREHPATLTGMQRRAFDAYIQRFATP